MSLKNRERVLSFHTNTHAHALKTGKKESAKRRRDAAGAAQTESKERLGSGHSARARARKIERETFFSFLVGLYPSF